MDTAETSLLQMLKTVPKPQNNIWKASNTGEKVKMLTQKFQEACPGKEGKGFIVLTRVLDQPYT